MNVYIMYIFMHILKCTDKVFVYVKYTNAFTG